MHQPADVSRKLLRFRPRQQHAVVQRVQKTSLRNPTPVLDQLLMHDRNLAGGTAKADEAELQPEKKGLSESDRFGTRLNDGRCERRCHSATSAFSNVINKPSKTVPAALTSWSSSSIESRSPASTLSTPLASGGCTPPASR